MHDGLAKTFNIFLELREGRRCQKGTQAIGAERFINKKNKINQLVILLISR